MAETKHILILANSRRPGGHCVAGKIATPLSETSYDVTDRWIRLVDPRNPAGGVAYQNTICRGKAIRPLDLIEVTTTTHCNNEDHPEDWFFDPTRQWQKVAELPRSCLANIVDRNITLWHDRTSANSVASGFVRTMQPHQFSICLVPGPPKMDFFFWKKTVHDPKTGQAKMKYVRDLSFHHSGAYHEFSVTDPEFMSPFWKKITEHPQAMNFPDASRHYLCLSLGLDFHGKQYKVGATIFQP